MEVCRGCCVLSGRSLCDELITRPEESYRQWCVVVCDLENLKNEEAKARVVLQRHKQEKPAYCVFRSGAVPMCCLYRVVLQHAGWKLRLDLIKQTVMVVTCIEIQTPLSANDTLQLCICYFSAMSGLINIHRLITCVLTHSMKV